MTRSLGLRTDLMLIRWDGVVDEVQGALRARRPSNPDFYYGNFLLFPDAPGPGDAPAWIARFGAAFANDPRIAHVTLRWDRAFLDGVLAADCGVFVENGLARFQSVETAAAFRRRGLCGTLVHHVARAAIAELGAETLVLVGLDDHTAKIYASCGFDRRERLVSALRRPTA